MSKIARYQGNVRAFASDAQGMERTVFGGTNQADDLTSQITASFLRGWGIVGAAEHPSLEDFNAAMYAMSQFIAYQHQMGVPEWHAEQEYHIGSICTHNGESYQSLQNANIGSQPPSAKWTPVLTSKNGLANLQLEETVKLAANALSAKIVGEVTNNGTMASANKPGWWRIAVADTDTVADFPGYPVGSKLYGYGMMFVEVTDGAWLQHYYAHNGHNAKRQDRATSITANVPWVVDYNTSNPQRDIAGNAATATTANAANTANVANTATTATKLKTPRTIAGVAFDGTTNIDLGFLGYGQLLSDVAASRVKNVSYTNDTLKPVVVYVRFNNENNVNRKIYVNNYMLIEINQNFGYDQPGSCAFIVPAGGVYRVETTGVIVGWVEMR